MTVPEKSRQTGKEISIPDFAAELSVGMLADGRKRAANAYRAAVRSFTGYVGDRNFPLKGISSGLMRCYEQRLKDNGLKMNSISFYMRNLRAIYNKAVAKKLLDPPSENPFARVYTGVSKAVDCALTEAEMRRMASLNPDDEHLRAAQLYFVFSFLARGMSFVDVAHLRKTDMHSDRIIYCQRKTGKFLSISITPAIRRILEYFRDRTGSSPRIFPILDKDGKGYDSSLTIQNRLLKTVAKMAGIRKNISTHAARHTWATVAESKRCTVHL
jgi:integrase